MVVSHFTSVTACAGIELAKTKEPKRHPLRIIVAFLLRIFMMFQSKMLRSNPNQILNY